MRDNFLMAFSSIIEHKLRTFLTMLGIIFGIASVIIIVAIGQGAEALLKKSFVGNDNTIEIFYQPPKGLLDQEIYNSTSQNNFNNLDLQNIKKIDEVKHAYGVNSDITNIRFRQQISEGSVRAVTNSYFKINPMDIYVGRSFTEADFIGGKRIGIISHSLKVKYFNNKDPIGKIIWIGSQSIKVIGVLNKESGLLATELPEVILPFSTYSSLYGNDTFSQLTVEVSSLEKLEEVGAKATKLLNISHKTDNSYHVLDMKEMSQGISKVTSIMTIVIGSVAALSLFVGGIGVMNIMLVSVTERTKEIGIRKALGATHSRILSQFLIESVTISIIGGIIGLLLGGAIALTIPYLLGWPALINWKAVFFSMIISIAVGVTFGLIPASKAAKLEPTEALRYE